MRAINSITRSATSSGRLPDERACSPSRSRQAPSAASRPISLAYRVSETIDLAEAGCAKGDTSKASRAEVCALRPPV
jgi:hypothetical protein